MASAPLPEPDPGPASESGPGDVAATGLAERVEHLGAVLADAGLPRLASRVFAQLMCDPDGRMTAAELAGALSASAAGISQAVNYLTRVQMIRREREPGSRRDVFVVLDDAWHDALLHNGAIYSRLQEAFLEVGQAVPPNGAAASRLGLSAEFLAFVQHEMAALRTRWDHHKTKTTPGSS